ncbi:MAG: cadmium-translocating P-type ATPase, partial [Oscillochloris sp.]|nr:cadmium-translocating P-type ATPase [Oscillochloris sp.]
MSTFSQTHTREPSGVRFSISDEIIEPSFVALTLVGIVAGILTERLGAPGEVHLAVNLVTYVVGGFYAVRAIIEALRERTIEVDLLMVLAALGAAYVDAWTEGAILLFLFSLSNVLQGYAMRRTERAISALLELRPDSVDVRRDDQVRALPLEDVVVGDVVLLRPGDRVPLDGAIQRGSGNFDESAITGEAMPVQRGEGSPVLAGTLNINGSIELLVTKHASESTLSRIINMVSEAQARKASTQSFLDRAEQYYAMGVIFSVLLFVTLVPIFLHVPFSENFYRGMVLLTVASPCALVISVPAALLSAIANAARHGVLFKGGAHLEELSKVKIIAFDKTGTLTFGRPEVMDVLPQPGLSADDLLAAVARAEHPSEHPIARAIMCYANAKGLNPADPEHFAAVTGMGVRASWDGEETLVGSPRLMTYVGLSVPAELLAEMDRLADEGRGTVLLAHRGSRWLGLVTVMDRERPDAAE